MALHYNVTGSTGVTVELIEPNTETDIKSIILTNIHATADATVTLFIQDDPDDVAFNTYKLLNIVAIQAKTALLLNDASMCNFSNVYGLYVTVGSSDTIDVSINY